MKIIDRVKGVRFAIIKNNETQGTLGSDVGDAALKATLGGRGSTDWEAYMTLFVDNEAQLKRLTGKEVTGEGQGYIAITSAYLVANGGCGGHTPRGLPRFLDPRIDEGLPVEPDGTIQRLFEISFPEVIPEISDDPCDETPLTPDGALVKDTESA